MNRSIPFSILSAFVLFGFVGFVPPAAAQDLREVLTSYDRAMSAVQSGRMTGSMDMVMASRGMNMSFSAPFEATFQSPDRGRVTVDIPMMGLSAEAIIIGHKIWARADEDPWELLDLTSLGMDSEMLHSSSYSLDPALLDRMAKDFQVRREGNSFRISGTLSLDDPGSPLKQAFDMGLASGPSGAPDVADATARMELVIDANTLLVSSMEVVVSGRVTELPRGQFTVTVKGTFSDYNSPSIVIRPPAGF